MIISAGIGAAQQKAQVGAQDLAHRSVAKTTRRFRLAASWLRPVFRAADVDEKREREIFPVAGQRAIVGVKAHHVSYTG